ncbi:MAG: hypothetical protein ACT4P1_06215 [Sporichthyaceae bacterium]
MSATSPALRFASVLTVTVLGAGSMGLFVGTAHAASSPTTSPSATPASIDWDIYTGKDGAPRYRLDGIEFGKGKVRVQIRNGDGDMLWTRAVKTRRDDGVSARTFHVGTNVRCDHRTRYARAKDPRTGSWTPVLTLDPCIV